MTRSLAVAVLAALAVCVSAAARSIPGSISAGFDHSCLVRSGSVECWGDNVFGALGDGTTVDRLSPVGVVGLPAAAESLARGSMAGQTCAVLSGGKLVCWGANEFGELGDGTNTGRSRPVAVSGLGSGVQEAAVGLASSCAVAADGGATCWGSNAFGLLGDGSDSPHLTPVGVSGLSSGVRTVSAGIFHTCAVANGGAAFCWGFNAAGQVGNEGCLLQCSTPMPVSGLSSGVEAVSAGGVHTCALLTGGRVACWGNNSVGELGDGTTRGRPAPVVVAGLAGVVAIGTGFSHTCALLGTGSVQCWGENDLGQLGDGTHVDRNRPVTVEGVSGAHQLAVGSDHSCVLLDGGAFRCWGSNHYGQLGNGRHTNLLSVAVKGHGSITGLGSRCVSRSNELCDAERYPGARLRLKAKPAKRWKFQRWTGACKRRIPRCTVVLRKDVVVKASFKKRRK